MRERKDEYKLELYKEINTILQNKIYIVNNEINNKIYIKKVLDKECYEVYKVLKENYNKNRAKVEECFIIDEKLIVIEEYINGTSLAEMIENKDISEAYAINILKDVCKGLEDLHGLKPQIIHRDIKPENIMISNDGVLKLIDFDAGRIVNNEKENDTRLLGTRAYASPEQFGFAETDNRTDIYSMGVLLNYLVVKEYPKDKLPVGELGRIIKKATEIDREKRYKNILELRLAFNKITPKEKKEVKEEKHKKPKKDFVEDIIYEKPEKRRGLVGFRSGKIKNKTIAWIWYGFSVCGIIAFISDRKLEDIALVVWMLIIPEIILGDFYFLDKYFEKHFKNINMKKSKKIIKIFLVCIVSAIVSEFMPS